MPVDNNITEAVNGNEEQFVAAWLTNRYSAVGHFILPVCAAISAVAAILFYFVAPDDARVAVVAVHGALAAILLVLSLIKGTWRFKATMLYVIELFVATAYAVILWGLLFHAQGAEAVTFVSSILLALCFIFIMICPLHGKAIAAAGVYYILLGVSIWMQTPYAAAMSVIYTCSTAIAVALEYVRLRQVQSEARSQFRQRELVQTNNRLKSEAIAKDLEIASRIQESLSPPTNPTHLCGFKVAHYMQKHHVIGGDWFALRSVSQDKLALLVVDAVGKGVQAGLVLHVAQTLWARSLSEPFDPAQWLSALNETLCRMGQRELQCMTAAVAVVSRVDVQYFSAGHIPMYCLSQGGRDTGSRIQAVHATGNMLGLDVALNLRPTTLTFDAENSSALLLGSDGVFDSSARITSSYASGLVRSLHDEGSAALDRLPPGDDKLCVVVEAA